MCTKPNPGEKVVAVRCRPKTYPCPRCGRRGHRKRRLDRYVRSLEYGRPLWLHVFYAEYTARCTCCKSFRSWVPQCCPKADYDNLVRQAVLNRILDDGLNVERTIAAMRRDFLLELSSGFIYDCLEWGLKRLNPWQQRRRALQSFSGYVGIDELHLGDFTLLLATDPIADRIIGYRLVKTNDQAHLRCFVRTLQYWGFEPKLVVTDGSNLYPAVLKKVWPTARHQLCIFHVLQDITNQILDAVRRLRRAAARRGNAGRKRPRGRPRELQQRRARRRGPTNKDKARFVYKHRFLIVKRTEHLTKQDWDDLCRMFQYLPQLRPLWHCCRAVYQVFSTEQVIRLARRRRTLLLKKVSYQEVPELVKVMGLLAGDKFDKMVAFLECSEGARLRTNNHVERTNRKLRYDEKVRYKFRTERSLNRFLCLRLDRLAHQALNGQLLSASSVTGPNTAPGKAANSV
jgi:Transposase